MDKNANFNPNPIKIPPVNLFNHILIWLLLFILRDSLAANKANMIHQMVPGIMKIMPSIKYGTGLCICPGATNCGKNTRKNNATLGFNKLVNIPDKYNLLVLTSVKAGDEVDAGFDKNILTPRYTRYTAPAYLMISKAIGDRATISDKPKATKVV